MAEPRIGEVRAKPTTAMHEYRRFYVGFGFSDRDTVQVRLEPDNESVYLSYTEVEGRHMKHATIPFASFVEALKAIVDSSR